MNVKKMFDNKLSISLHKKIKKIFKEKSFTKPHKIKISKALSTISIKDTKQNIINSLSKNPEYIMREYSKINPKDFDTYIETLDNSMNNYQLTYEPKEPKERNKYQDNNKDEMKKYMDKKDTILIKKLYKSNKKYLSKGLTPRNDESNLKIFVNERNYSNPFQSLGVINQNHFIYDEINKEFLNRQGDLFKQKILTIQKYKNKFRTKMPKIHISQSNRIPFDIPVVDLTDDKDKKNFSSLPNLSKNQKKTGKIKLFAYYRYTSKNFPEGREQFSIFLKNNNKLYVCGGLTVNITGMIIWCLNLENLEWSKVLQKETEHNRFGHTGTVYQNKIYFFGGRTKNENGFSYQGFEIFSINEGIYYTPNMGKVNCPQLRRNHIAELINDHILIYGGIAENNEILNDCYLLNINQLKWHKVNINKMTPGPKLYGHTSSLVIPRQQLLSHKFNIYTYPDIEVVNCRIKQKGLYIFGGKSKEEGGISNKLWILILGQKILEWVLQETKGKPPRPRFNHSMNFYERGNLLIIHGGRNDNLSETSAFDDTFVLDLEIFEWFSVELYSHLSEFKVLSRCGHQSIIYNNKLIIFGGMNNNNYIGSSLFIVNLDFSYNNDQKSFQEIMIRQLKDKNDTGSKQQMIKLKNDLKIIPIGIVTSINSINLPSIK